MSTGLLPPLGSTLTEGLAAGLAITALRGLALAACGSHPGTAGAPTIAPKDWEPSWAYDGIWIVNLRPDFWFGGRLIEVGYEGVNFGVVGSETTSNIQFSIDKEGRIGRLVGLLCCCS